MHVVCQHRRHPGICEELRGDGASLTYRTERAVDFLGTSVRAAHLTPLQSKVGLNEIYFTDVCVLLAGCRQKLSFLCFLSLSLLSPTGSTSRINQPSLPTPFYSVTASVSVFMALSTVFHSIHSPDNSPFSDSVLSLPYWSFQLHISLWKSAPALI